MPKYDIPVWKMCKEAAKELPEIFAPIDVIRKVKEKRPEVKESTIRAHVIALAPNHPSSKHYGRKHRLFHYLGNGRYRLLKPKEDIPPSRVEDVAEEEEAAGFSFEFEANLEGHLANNLGDIEEGLTLYVSPDGVLGRQFQTDVGRIDILALDKDENFCVIELKVGQATDKACSQILKYMGWVKRHMVPDREVRGIIVCMNATDALKYATSTLENVSIKEYEVHFSFHEADLEVE
ncbi:MAG: endonuclease NucS domain-containing protein [Candidatus Bathyarchaeia archaeon]